MVCGIYIHHHQCILQRLIDMFYVYVSMCHSAAASRRIFHEVVNNYFPILQKYCDVCGLPVAGTRRVPLVVLFAFSHPVQWLRCCAAALVRCGSHDAQSVYWKSGLFIAAAATHLAWHAPVSTRPGPVRTQQSGTTSLSPADIEYCGVLILLHLNCDVNPQSGPIHALAFSLNDFFCLPSIHPRIPVYTLTLHSNTCVSRKK